MNKITITCIIFLICSQLSFAQKLPLRPWEPLTFNGITPTWYETRYHPGMENDTCDGRNLFRYNIMIEPIKKEGLVYTLSNINYGLQTWGAYIDCREYNTGKLVWQTKYERDELEYQDMPRKMFINGKDELVVIGNRRMMKQNESHFYYLIFSDSTKMTYRAYDRMTGNLKEYHAPSNDDPKAPRIIASANDNSNFFFTEKEDEYLYTQRLQANYPGIIFNQFIRYFKINKYGEAISPEDTIYTGEYNVTHLLFQKNLDTLLYIEVDSATQEKIRFKYYSPDFKLYRSVDLDSPLGVHGIFSVLHIDSNYIELYNGADYPDWTFKYASAIYDLNGNIINWGSLEYDINNYYVWADLKYIPSLDKIICIARAKEDNRLDIFEFDKGKTRLLKSFYVGDSMMLMSVVQMYIFEPNKILAEIISASFYVNDQNKLRVDENSVSMSNLLLDLSTLGFPVSTKDGWGEVNGMFRISPNPVSDRFDIYCDESLMETKGNYQLYDMSSRLIGTYQKNVGLTKTSLDVSNFVNGIYYLRYVPANSLSAPHSMKFVVQH